MFVLTRIAVALERIAHTQAREFAARERERAEHALNAADGCRRDDDAIKMAEQQLEGMQRANDINEASLRKREEWEATEREHMKVCAKRFERMVAEGAIVPPAGPIKH
jgi:hypothetical protein